MRQNAKRRKHNRERRSRMRNLTKSVLAETDKTEAENLFRQAVSHIDRLSSRGILHQNNAARKKAQLSRHINNL